MKNRLILFCLGTFIIFHALPFIPALLAFWILGLLLYPQPMGQCNVATLSVPEILQDVLEAFKLRTPELFGPEGFGTDFSSQTAVLNDKITAHIDLLPVAAAYDPTPGVGFYSGIQDVENLIQDVPVTLSNFTTVPVRVKWLTQLSSKIPLYKRAVHNIAYALGKKVVDGVLAGIVGNFSNKIVINPNNVSLDSMEQIRTQMNTQKAMDEPRFGLMTSGMAGQLQADDRVKSSLFYGMLNGNRGFRVFQNLAGFSWAKEYPDLSLMGNNVTGVFMDPRFVTVASRKPDFSNAAADLGVPEIMRFFPMSDPESGINMIGVMWQEQGTGNVQVAVAILWGVTVGNQGGAAGTATDNAGVVVTSA